MASLVDGSLVLGGVLVTPRTTLTSFLAAAPSVTRGGVAAFAMLYGDADLDGTAFSGTAMFSGERLERVSLTVDDASIIGTSWEDYDPSVARAWHDAFLAERFSGGVPWNAGSYPYGGIEYRMRWGTVGSYVHPQDQGAVIVLAYR